ncbi:Vacuolar amino acid transporter 5 [Cucumispora dikerogammari]|nr:Vacuolar amino acid transporter 5 [Cucumispora dikerogammari]
MSLSNSVGIAVLVGSMLGYGIITLPTAFANVGMLGGCIFLTISAFFSFLSLYLFFKASLRAIENSENRKGVTIYELFESISPILGDVCNMILAIFVFLATVTYQRNIADFGLLLLGKFSSKNFTESNYSRLYIAVPLAVIEFGLSMLPSLDVLGKVSYLSIPACILVGMLCVRYAKLVNRDKLELEVFKMEGLSTALGNIVFALSAHPMVPALASSLSPTSSPFIISIGGVFVGGLLCLTMGAAGYLTGGKALTNSENILTFFSKDDTPLRQSIKLSSFDSKGNLIIVAVMLFMVLLSCSYALLLFSAKRSLFDTINRHLIKYDQNSSQYRAGLIVVAFLWIIATTFMSALFYPESLLSINGIYLGNTLCFILPSIAFISHCGKKNAPLYGAAILVFLVGISSISYSTYRKIKGF